MERESAKKEVEFEITVPSGIKLKSLLVNGEQIIGEEGKCWCQYPDGNKFRTIFVVPPSGRPIPIYITHCPTCGRRV